VTIVPLLLFASAVRCVPLSTMGLLQFISPTIQLVLALGLYHEPFRAVACGGFVAVWVAAACVRGAATARASRADPP
jgi:chloramphenicol-sensitive protein RarD